KADYRINNQISAPKIRLVGDNLDPGVYSTSAALQWAKLMDLDLIMISANASPPVCKIIDFKKFLYMKKKRDKEVRTKSVKTVIKEIRFGPNTDEHDFDFKLRHAKRFLEEGSKVKAYVHFRGRSIVFKDRGELLLLKFLKELEALGSAESLPKLEGRRMNVMIQPLKKPTSKKSGGKSKGGGKKDGDKKKKGKAPVQIEAEATDKPDTNPTESDT
ncbi:UNVERIFIED_CONTAM: hypothetical protein GTU68_002955, partial [Idotea baltica]|nr:hypothetical protein [Idotea baltica]